MTRHTPAEVTRAITAERPMRDITHTDRNGTVWRFWAHGPRPHTAWLTDGTGRHWKLWNVKYDYELSTGPGTGTPYPNNRRPRP